MTSSTQNTVIDFESDMMGQSHQYFEMKITVGPVGPGSIMDGDAWDLLVDLTEDKSPQSTIPVILAIGGEGDQDFNLRSVELYDFLDKQWYRLGAMPYSWAHGSGVVVGGKVYLVGGIKNGAIVRDVDKCDPIENILTTEITKMPTMRYTPGVAVFNDEIYVMGGLLLHNAHYLNTVEVFNMKVNGSWEWRNITNMNTRRRDMGLGILDGRLYAVGGNAFGQAVSTVEYYEPERDVWRAAANMTACRLGASVVELGGYLYCVGGCNNNGVVLRSVEKYNPATNHWSWVASMNYPRSSAGVLSHDGRMYVIGGYGGGEVTYSSVEMYNPQTDTWTMMTASMTSRRRAHAVVIVHRPVNFAL